jgi:hypothetical protein
MPIKFSYGNYLEGEAVQDTGDNIKKYLRQTGCDDVKLSLNSGPIILSTPELQLRKQYKSYCCEYNIFNTRILIHIKSVHDAVTVTVRGGIAQGAPFTVTVSDLLCVPRLISNHS